jgi:uncharacterized protein (DUF736 family)
MKTKVPTKGKQYHFFDDGKIRESRHYMATVVDKITPEQAKDIYMNYQGMNISVSLYTIWREEIDSHRQSKNFKVLTSGSMEVGAPWLYAEKTDYFIKCSIPDYDENDVWFVRTVDGGWFSLNTVDTWMAGRLDVTGSLFEYMNEMIKEWQDMSSTT